VAGYVVRELSPVTSSWRSRQSLDEYLTAHNIPGLEGVDTRAITKKLRVTGALKACLSTEGLGDAEAVRRAREWPGLIGIDYVKEVTCKAPYVFAPIQHEEVPFTVRGTHLQPERLDRKRYKVVAFDYGAKRSILRKLVYHGFDVTVVPAITTAAEVDKMKPDAVFLSNGPGDPAALDYAHHAVNGMLNRYPIFGICLGHQIITHALGANTFKLKFGHRGGNQPVKNIETGHVSITAQNHGFASRPEEIAKVNAVVTEINLNDQTVEGLRHAKLPVFSVQYHPEAAPGPNDADPLFEAFYTMVQKCVG